MSAIRRRISVLGNVNRNWFKGAEAHPVFGGDRDLGEKAHWGFDPGLSEEALWDHMLAVFATRLGTSSALYGFLPSLFRLEEGLISHSLIFRHNHPPEVFGAAEGQTALDQDPCALRLASGEPWFFWHEAANWSGNKMEQPPRPVADNSNGDVGVTIRLPFFDGRAIAGLGLCARGATPDAFAALWRNGMDEHLAIARAFDAAMRPRMIGNRFKLTRREISVLRLLAAGLTAKAAAERLGLRPKTVFNVMEKSRLSLQSSTTLEAVTKALAYRLI